MNPKSVLSVLVLASAIVTLGTVPVSAYECGEAYFSREINWQQQQTLYFTVAGAPANTCGDLYSRRNTFGSTYTKEADDWICTNSSGSQTAGPWYHYNQADDETSSHYIDWGSCTSPVAHHIWDVDPPAVSITSTAPGNFAGSAVDDAWGAGFNDDWAYCYAEYYNATTQKWWDLTGYNETAGPVYILCSFSGTPSLNVSWYTTTSQRPPLAHHNSGDHYYWRIKVWDGGQWSLQDEVDFIY